MNTRKIITYLASMVFICVLKSQTLLEEINHAYNRIDSANYLGQIKETYVQNLKRTYNTNVLEYNESLVKKWEDILAEQVRSVCFANSIHDSITRQQLKDSLSKTHSNILADKYYTNFILNIKQNSIYSIEYVLKLNLKADYTLAIDTGKYKFNIYYIDAFFRPRNYIFVGSCDDFLNDCYIEQTTYYPAYNKKTAHHAPIAIRKILHKHPQHLLYCSDLGPRYVLYLQDNKFFIYDISKKKEYKFEEFVATKSSSVAADL